MKKPLARGDLRGDEGRSNCGKPHHPLWRNASLPPPRRAPSRDPVNVGYALTAQFVALSAEATKEFTRLYAHLQQSSFEMWRASQDEAFRWQSLWLQWSQQAFGESLKNGYRTSRMFNDTVAAVTESLKRLQATAEQTGREMQDVVSGTAGKLQELSSRAA